MIKINKVLSYLFALIGFFSLKPYVIWDNNYPYYLSIIFLMLFFLFFLKRELRVNIALLYALILFLMYFYVVYEEVPAFFTGSFITIILFLMTNKTIRIQSFEVFDKVIASILFLSLITYPLIVFNIIPSFGVIESTNLLKNELGFYYNNYIFNLVLSNQIIHFGYFSFFRFSSVFDEPGVVGTLCGLIFCLKGFKLNNIRGKIYFISGLLSFSFAFYIFLLAALLFKFNKKTVIIILLLIPVFFIANSTFKGNPFYDKFVTSRYIYDTSGISLVNNRVSDCFNYELTKLNDGSDFFGFGNNAHKSTNCDVSSYSIYIYDYGYLGFSLVIIFFGFAILYMLSFYRIKKTTYLYVVFLLSLSLYQRPDFFFFYMYLLPFAVVKENNNI